MGSSLGKFLNYKLLWFLGISGWQSRYKYTLRYMLRYLGMYKGRTVSLTTADKWRILMTQRCYSSELSLRWPTGLLRKPLDIRGQFQFLGKFEGEAFDGNRFVKINKKKWKICVTHGCASFRVTMDTREARRPNNFQRPSLDNYKPLLNRVSTHVPFMRHVGWPAIFCTHKISECTDAPPEDWKRWAVAPPPLVTLLMITSKCLTAH